MSNIERNPNCPMRTSLGICDTGGGFCISVKSEVCNALHNAYQVAFLNGQKFEREQWKREIEQFLPNFKKELDKIYDSLQYIPTAESKVGKWLDGERVGYNGVYYYRYCSECLFERNDDDGDKDTPYCPNCGARMKGE